MGIEGDSGGGIYSPREISASCSIPTWIVCAALGALPNRLACIIVCILLKGLGLHK